MKNILILGAGRSSSTLIHYMLDNSKRYNWKITLGDTDEDLARKKIDNHPNGSAVFFDVFDEQMRNDKIKQADIVISMLPARMHYLIAESCIRHNKNMVTASYISQDVNQFDQEARKRKVLILNEIGVDPGIDHMSAMQMINRIKEDGGHITEFESNTGGLVAPRYDNNPWNYKFTWNPRNVVLAGQSGAQFLHNGKYKYIPYHKIFRRYERIHVLDLGEFEAYPNRDSLKYRDTYGLNDVSTMFRGTIRRPGFCRAWDNLVQLGATDDSFSVVNSENITYREFINSFLAYSKQERVEEKLARYLGHDEDSEIMYKLRWLGLFQNDKPGILNASPAMILQKRLEEKWKLDDEDKDMIVMQHQFTYEKNGKRKKIVSSMVTTGETSIHTAMSRTVGLPVAIASKLILQGVINLSGVYIPIEPEIYNPVMKELEQYGIKFIEEEVEPAPVII
ncbi:MAG TPA: saccharopine dehydrogenase C-terminal domain-containing protein [Bacteroidales bacterium]|nr:saccharopine dehydrogenase C-terminal domain-containing protein [Bacteroidales bacterium]